MRFKNKLHYTLKYIVISLPIILILFSWFGGSFKDSVDLPFIDILESCFNTFKGLDINAWYDSLLTSIGLSNNLFYINYLLYFPLYVMWIYIIDIVLDLLLLIPNLLHDFSERKLN